MLYFLFSIILLVIQTFLIITVRINLYPEFFSLPWFVKNGLVPYRDFFDHHGFILYYLLAPLSSYKNLFFLKTAFVLTQSINLLLVLLILKKSRNSFSFVFGSILYLLLSFYITENTPWYEFFITTVYLFLYHLILQEDFRFKKYIVGLLVFFATAIKPTAIFILIPIFLLYRNRSIVFVFTLLWLLVAVYFLSPHGLGNFIDNFIFFNIYYADYFSKRFSVPSDLKLLLGMLSLFSLSHLVLFLTTRRNIPLLLFGLLSLVFVFPTNTKANFVPFITFLSISTSAALFYSFNRKRVFLSLSLFSLVFFFFLSYKTLNHYFFLKNQRVTYLEIGTAEKIATHLKNSNYRRKKTYILSNQIELYYFLDQPTPTYFPLIFPWIADYYPNMQDRIIDDLKKSNVRVIIVPIPIDENYLQLSKLIKFVKNNFFLVEQTGEFQIYVI